jgi:hypothetical protein
MVITRLALKGEGGRSHKEEAAIIMMMVEGTATAATATTVK